MALKYPHESQLVGSSEVRKLILRRCHEFNITLKQLCYIHQDDPHEFIEGYMFRNTKSPFVISERQILTYLKYLGISRKVAMFVKDKDDPMYEALKEKIEYDKRVTIKKLINQKIKDNTKTK